MAGSAFETNAPAESEEAYHSTNHHKYTTENRLYQWHLRQFMDQLYEMVARTEPHTVLDAGCGEGFVTAFLNAQDPSLHLTGVDLSEGAIAYARRRFGTEADFRSGDLYALPFEDNGFDTVVCSEVLEHLEEPQRAAQELRRVARQHVVVSVPREPYFQWLNGVGRWLGLSPDPGHVNFWTKRTFRDFITRQYRAPTFAYKHVYQLAAAEV